MGRFLIKHADHIRRAQRLSLFCKEVKRAILNLCVDRGVSIHSIDFFMEDLFMQMEYHEQEYAADTLLKMLLDEDFINESFYRYAEKA